MFAGYIKCSNSYHLLLNFVLAVTAERRNRPTTTALFISKKSHQQLPLIFRRIPVADRDLRNPQLQMGRQKLFVRASAIRILSELFASQRL